MRQARLGALAIITSIFMSLGAQGCAVDATDGAEDDAAGTESAALSTQYVFPRLFAGGVSGVDALANPANSTQFRGNGGGFYLHHSGFAPLSEATKNAIVSTWKDKEVVVEIGFGVAEAWRDAFMANYYNRGLRPVLVTANAFDRNNLATPAAWSHFIDVFRAAGVEQDTLIVPTFEYANFAENIATLSNNKISQRADFQAMVKTSKGLNLDCPPSFFFAREQAYRDWIVDAIQYAHGHGFMASVIVSPHDSKANYDTDAQKFVNYLHDHQAMPNVINVENYSTESPATYPNIVGNENNPDHELGCALKLQTSFLPPLLGRTDDKDGDGKANEPSPRADSSVSDFKFEFDTAGDLENWTKPSNIAGSVVTGGAYRGQTTSADPNLVLDRDSLFFDGGAVRYLHIRLLASAAGGVQVYFGTDHGGFTADQVMAANYTTPNQWQTLTLPMHEHAGWDHHNITSLRVDPIGVANASFQIDFIRGSRRAPTP